MEATLPNDYQLTIQIWDYDSTTSDDLIGETKIDIENRYYSKHYANCGLSKYYNTYGFNKWRDKNKPSKILKLLTIKNNLSKPEYYDNYVKIGGKKFFYDYNQNYYKNEDDNDTSE